MNESALTEHYFKFSTNWQSGKRLCGTCDLTYDAGSHIEVDNLKPFTNYVCPTGGGLGHSSVWTGDRTSRPELNSLRDAYCMCGAEFVEVDNESWTLTWEMKDPWSDEWRTVSNTQSKHAAHAQRDGLLELIHRGEDVRNVVLEDDALASDVLDEIAAERERQDAKWGEQNHPNGTGPKTTPVAEIVRGKANAITNRHYAFGLALQAKSATDSHAKDGTVTFADILLEEVFEALAEEEPAKLRTELIQVAAVAAQWVEAIDRADQ